MSELQSFEAAGMTSIESDRDCDTVSGFRPRSSRTDVEEKFLRKFE